MPQHLYFFEQARMYYKSYKKPPHWDAYSYRFTKKYWDNAPPSWHEPFDDVELDDNHTALKNIQKYFGKDHYYARVMKPLGDFKDLIDDDLSHEEMYYAMVEELEKKRVFKYKGKKFKESYLRVIHMSYKYAIEKCKAEYDMDEFLEGLSIMLYRSSEGVYLEKKTIEETERQLRFFRIKAIAAEGKLEKEDVDMVLINEDGKKIYVSIKNCSSLKKSVIDSKRKFGKTKPTLYMGLDKKGNLQALDVDGDEVNISNIRNMF